MTSPQTVLTFQAGEEIQFEDGTTGYVYTAGNPSNDESQPIVIPVRNEMEVPVSEYFSSSSSNNQQFPQIELVDNYQKVSQHDNRLVLIPVSISSLPQSTPLVSVKNHSSSGFPCKINGCGKIFSTSYHLKVHQRSHRGDKQFQCETCKKLFTTNSALKTHRRIHTGEKPHQCPHNTCNKAFKSASDLQKHIRTHTGDRPFKCPFDGCGKSFTTSDICKVHIRTHTGERPHKCIFAECNKSFSNLTNLRNHIRIHTGEKPFVCSFPGCNKRFTEHSSLYKHQRAHNVQTRYDCPLCDKSFQSKKTLTFHKKKIHLQYDGLSNEKADDIRKTTGQVPVQITPEIKISNQVESSVVKASFNPTAVMVPVETIASTFVNSIGNPQISILPLSNNLQLPADNSSPMLVTLPYPSEVESPSKATKYCETNVSTSFAEDESLIYINKQNRKPITSSNVNSEAKSSRNVFAEPKTSRNIFSEPRTSRNVFSEPRTSRNVFSEPRTSRNVFSEPKTSCNVFSEPKTSRSVQTKSKTSRNVFSKPKTSRNVNAESISLPTKPFVSSGEKFDFPEKEFLWQASTASSTQESHSEENERFSVGTLEIDGTEYIVQVVNSSSQIKVSTDVPDQDEYFHSVEPVVDVTTVTSASPGLFLDEAFGVDSTLPILTTISTQTDLTDTLESPTKSHPVLEKSSPGKSSLFSSAKRRITVTLPKSISKRRKKT